jgi:PAS domain S-box-containing protein
LLPAESPLFDFFRSWRGSFFVICGFCLVLLMAGASGEATERPRRVLMLYSYGRNLSPYSTVISAFKTEMAEQSKVPLEFHEVSLAAQQVTGDEPDQPTIKYLQTLSATHMPDLMVTWGKPAARFALRLRSQLYPSAPLLLTLIDTRYLKAFTLDTNTAVVASQWDLPKLIEPVLRVLPATTNVAVVIGGSRVEAVWKHEMQRGWAGFTNRLAFMWLNQCSLEEMRQKVGQLPPHTVIVYVSLFVDAAGVPREYDTAIKILHKAANAPMVGLYEEALGLGILGGPMRNLQNQGRESGRAAARILSGEAPAIIHASVVTIGTPVYDWRELRRWNISEDRLPPGSIVKYRARTTWERYRFWIITGVSGLLVEAALIAGLLLNLARRRKAECLMRDSEERMELAASAAQLGIWEWDFASDKVWLDGRSRERMGPIGERDSGYSRFLRTVHPDDRDSVAKAVASAISGDGNYEHVHRRVVSDGQIRWIAARARVEFDAERKPVRMRGVGMDITARKLAEEQARESERQFLLIANSTPVFIWTSGRDKLCTFVNRAWLEFRGRTLEQELGNVWAEGVHPEDIANCLNTYVEAFEARQPFTMEYRWRRHDGSYRWVTVHGAPRHDVQKNFLGYVGSCVDVTERKEAEMQAQRSREELAHVGRVSTLGELAGSLAHELNQPLSAILTNVEVAKLLVEGKSNDEEVRDALTDIGKQGQRAGEIIAGIRGMLKKEPGQLVDLDLNVAVRAVLEMVRHDLASRGVRAVLQLDPKLPAVKGHGVQLRQVVLNLVMNACDAMSDTPASARELTIVSRRVATDEVEVSVTDSGSGFPEQVLLHAFEPFHSTKAKGLGLGLAICRSIIIGHGGRLTAANNSGKGATVRFILPARGQIGI